MLILNHVLVEGVEEALIHAVCDHADHIGQQTVHFSECLVCDFSAQPYLSGVVSSFSHFSEYLALATFFRQPELLHRSAGPVALRAPPFRTARG